MLKQVSQTRATDVTAYAILLLSNLIGNLKGHIYDILDAYVVLKIYLVLFFAVRVWPAPPVPTEVRRGHQRPWNWCHRLLWAAIWVLGRKPRSSGGTKDQRPWKADKQWGGQWLGKEGGDFQNGWLLPHPGDLIHNAGSLKQGPHGLLSPPTSRPLDGGVTKFKAWSGRADDSWANHSFQLSSKWATLN